MRRAVGVVLLALLMAGQSVAQPRPPAPKPSAAPEKPAEPPPPPYEPQLLRLAEILGSLALLRPLCGHDDGEVWRARMGALIEVEAGTQARKEALAGAFNRGYAAYARTYRACTASARLAIERYVSEGVALSRDVSNRFRG